jgi:hypothetical protein
MPQDLAPAPLQSQSVAKPDKQIKITRKVRDAITAMVWEGLKRDEAAMKAGMKDNSLYIALRRPDVKAFYLAECDVLRTSGRARRIHRLEQMVEQDDNKAAVVNAVLALERLDPNETAASRANSLPGLQIVIMQGGTERPTVDITPMPSDQIE